MIRPFLKFILKIESDFCVCVFSVNFKIQRSTLKQLLHFATKLYFCSPVP